MTQQLDTPCSEQPAKRARTARFSAQRPDSRAIAALSTVVNHSIVRQIQRYEESERKDQLFQDFLQISRDDMYAVAKLVIPFPEKMVMLMSGDDRKEFFASQKSREQSRERVFFIESFETPEQAQRVIRMLQCRGQKVCRRRTEKQTDSLRHLVTMKLYHAEEFLKSEYELI